MSGDNEDFEEEGFEEEGFEEEDFDENDDDHEDEMDDLNDIYGFENEEDNDEAALDDVLKASER